AQVLLSNHLDDLHLERRIERSPGLGFGHFYSSQTLISLIGMSFEIRPAQFGIFPPPFPPLVDAPRSGGPDGSGQKLV
ncbi:hypothetical protein, partial [Polaromonas sp. YR568]|uniref:hypothetical protein n=1 Tax=Polaromonas sp. YR568 TaxID=1855301 RepID=UPI00398C221D